MGEIASQVDACFDQKMTDIIHEEKQLGNKKLFQIGDVAKMFHISVGSLRHYEQAGL